MDIYFSFVVFLDKGDDPMQLQVHVNMKSKKWNYVQHRAEKRRLENEMTASSLTPCLRFVYRAHTRTAHLSMPDRKAAKEKNKA